MSRPNRTRRPRPISDLKADLALQVERLQNNCRAFDDGSMAAAYDLATVLNVLLFDPTKGSPPLMKLLGIRDGVRFVNFCRKHEPANTVPECLLTAIHLDTARRTATYFPVLSTDDTVYEAGRRRRLTPYSEWCTEVVVSDARGATFCRLDLVEEIRNRDGGGHLGSVEHEEFASFKSGKYMGWTLLDHGVDKGPVPHPHPACIRQIAHEVLLTLHLTAPDCFNAAYVFPARPGAERYGLLVFDAEIVGLQDESWFPTAQADGLRLYCKRHSPRMKWSSKDGGRGHASITAIPNLRPVTSTDPASAS